MASPLSSQGWRVAAGARRHNVKGVASCMPQCKAPLHRQASLHASCKRRQQLACQPCMCLPGRRPASTSSQGGQQVSANALPFTERLRVVPAATVDSGARLRVAVDVDEVLGRFVYALNQFCEAQYNMQHEVSDYWIYEFAKIWGCDQNRSNHIVHEFFKSSHFRDGIPVIPGAYQSLTRLSEMCDLVVVTSRQHVIEDQTLEWIDQHYPGIFQEVYFGNHWSLEGVSRKKSDICRTVGASVLIDDNPTYAVECAKAGIHVLLYDWDHAYPWSKLDKTQQHPLIHVVRDWQEVEVQLHKLAPELHAKAAAQAGNLSGSSNL